MTTVDAAFDKAGTGPFQYRLLGIFGLVWAADAMQVLSVGFTAPTIAQEFGLTVPVALQTGTAFFLGMMFGAAIFGRLADRFGRRTILLVTVALDGVFGLLSALAPDFWFLLAFRFLTGLAVGGTLPVDYAMMAEFLPARNRGRWLVALEGFWAVGTLAVALAAWALSLLGVANAWRWIFVFTALPAAIGIWLRLWLPESPRYLLRVGRAKEATAVVNQVLVANGQASLGASRLAPGDQPKSEGLLSPGLRRRTLLILAVWFLVSLSYYGVFVWIPARLASEGFGFVRGYGFLVLVALAQIPGYALAAYGVEQWGRKPTLFGFALLSAAGCFLFVVAGTPVVVGAAILLMSFALLGTWGALYAFTPEIYPTGARATGMGTAGAMARVGGLLAPSVLAPVVAHSLAAAVAAFAVFLVGAAIATWLIDVETRQQVLA
ncbi:MFS transporter [Rhodoligotrophos defluvii]|uniref:MFS transporter n=1 Tax=Rhodoligotrophos defluvii TaxID=2561934 RepID=UPI0010C98443|nr:MFS transporter [Rhodoligotrophos defluvii]